MHHSDDSTPVVMCFSGVEPTGGSGVTADIETLVSLGCHCCPIATAITSRDTQTIKDIWDIDSPIVIQQARAILEDMSVKAVKIGMLASVDNIEAVHTILVDYPHLPVILDPVVKSGTDSQEALIEATRTLLCPQTRLAVLNAEQIRLLAPEADSLQASAQVIVDLGCDYVFASGSPDHARRINNRLFSSAGLVKSYEWPLIDHRFVGAGSTLSAGIAAYLSHQDSVLEAVEQGQKFTFQALESGRRLGMGNRIPNRIFWCKQ